MADGRCIDESELVEEIVETWKDAQMFWDKVLVYEDGGVVKSGDAEAAGIAYSRHISKLDEVRRLVTLGKKYFQHGQTDWDTYNVHNPNVPSWDNPADMIERLSNNTRYTGLSVDKDIIGLE